MRRPPSMLWLPCLLWGQLEPLCCWGGMHGVPACACLPALCIASAHGSPTPVHPAAALPACRPAAAACTHPGSLCLPCCSAAGYLCDGGGSRGHHLWLQVGRAALWMPHSMMGAEQLLLPEDRQRSACMAHKHCTLPAALQIDHGLRSAAAAAPQQLLCAHAHMYAPPLAQDIHFGSPCAACIPLCSCTPCLLSAALCVLSASAAAGLPMPAQLARANWPPYKKVAPWTFGSLHHVCSPFLDILALFDVSVDSTLIKP